MRTAAANKRPMTQTKDPGVLGTIHGASKAALGDLVIDLLRRLDGDESLDGDALAAAYVEAMKPIALARGDAPPKPWRPKAAHARARKGAAPPSPKVSIVLSGDPTDIKYAVADCGVGPTPVVPYGPDTSILTTTEEKLARMRERATGTFAESLRLAKRV